MLPNGYNPENYGGQIWWNEENNEMCLIWGTQETYDNFKSNGGTWYGYSNIAHQRMEILNESLNMELPDFILENVKEERIKVKTK